MTRRHVFHVIAGVPWPKGRGAAGNPPNRYEPVILERDPDWDPAGDPAPRTQFFRDHAQTIISHNDSPDVGAGLTLNPYRGCEHGCAYCYARRTHDYLGFGSGLDFETRIMVKTDAPELLRRELSSPRWKPAAVGMCGVTDPYQPAEKRLGLTRRCLQVFLEFRNPVCVVTKNFLVTRDLDILRELAAHKAVRVSLSINSLDPELVRVLEPRASSPRERLRAVELLRTSGVPAGVLVAPVIPGLNEHEIAAVLKAARAAGALWAYHQVVRLPETVAPVFEAWLDQHAPGRKEKVLNGIRAVHAGQLSDTRFGIRMRGEGERAEQIAQLFEVTCRKLGFNTEVSELSTAAFRRPNSSSAPAQLDLAL